MAGRRSFARPDSTFSAVPNPNPKARPTINIDIKPYENENADGAPVAQAPLSSTGFESLTPTDINTTLVGSSGNGSYSAFGQINDLGIWTRPLSEAEVIGIYLAGTSGNGIPEVRTGAPTLSVVVSTTVIRTCPAWANGYTLQSSAALSPASRTPVRSTPAIVGADAAVTLPLSPSKLFFRLRN